MLPRFCSQQGLYTLSPAGATGHNATCRDSHPLCPSLPKLISQSVTGITVSLTAQETKGTLPPKQPDPLDISRTRTIVLEIKVHPSYTCDFQSTLPFPISSTIAVQENSTNFCGGGGGSVPSMCEAPAPHTQKKVGGTPH
jgi:hypothetical protein